MNNRKTTAALVLALAGFLGACGSTEAATSPTTAAPTTTQAPTTTTVAPTTTAAPTTTTVAKPKLSRESVVAVQHCIDAATMTMFADATALKDVTALNHFADVCKEATTQLDVDDPSTVAGTPIENLRRYIAGCSAKALGVVVGVLTDDEGLARSASGVDVVKWQPELKRLLAAAR